jgi:hypothetical protein
MHAVRDSSQDTSPYRVAFHRIRAEYVEMPAMRLTPAQLERLSGVDTTVCKAVLDDLVRAGFLRVGDDGRYVRYAHDVALYARAARRDDSRPDAR